MKDLYWTIDGEVYDLTPFFDPTHPKYFKHPGGLEIINEMRGHDVTFHFHSYHFIKLPDISAYKVKGEVLPTVTPFSCNMKKADPFFDEVREAVRAELKGKNIKITARRAAWILPMCVLSIYLWVLMIQGHWIGLLSTFFYWTSMGCLFHDLEHFALTRNPYYKWLVRLYSAYFIDAPTWRVVHNYTHHVYTNILDYDSDLAHNYQSHRTHPGARFRPHFAYQIYYYVFLLPLVIFPVRFLHTLLIVGRKRMAPKLRAYTGLPTRDVIGLNLIKLVIFYYMSIRPFYVFEFWKALIFATWFPCTFSFQFLLFSQVNHLTETSTRNLSKTAWSADTWSKHQILTSTNWAIYKDTYTNSLEDWIHYLNATFWFVWSCGLNYQIEHHLFPSVNHEHIPKISAIVRQICAKHNVRYNHLGSFWEALVAHFTHVESCSHPSMVNVVPSVEVLSKVN